MVTIILNDYPALKFVLIGPSSLLHPTTLTSLTGLMGLFVLTGKEQ
jgi:hypothetical protein